MNRSILILLFFSFSQIIQSQDNFNVSITPTHERTIPQNQLSSAKTLTDINRGFPASWISTYISTEIITVYNQVVHKSIGVNETLSLDQIKQLAKVDLGSDIQVNVKYIPDNALKHNEVKEIDFAYTVIPEQEAAFIGGADALNIYLKDHIIDEIPIEKRNDMEMIELSFNVSEDGEIIDVSFGSHAKDDLINTLILESIRNMPKWIPAKTTDGLFVKQAFEFRMGKSVGC